MNIEVFFPLLARSSERVILPARETNKWWKIFSLLSNLKENERCCVIEYCMLEKMLHESSMCSKLLYIKF